MVLIINIDHINKANGTKLLKIFISQVFLNYSKLLKTADSVGITTSITISENKPGTSKKIIKCSNLSNKMVKNGP